MDAPTLPFICTVLIVKKQRDSNGSWKLDSDLQILLEKSPGGKFRDLRQSCCQVLDPAGEHEAVLDVIRVIHDQEKVRGRHTTIDHGVHASSIWAQEACLLGPG